MAVMVGELLLTDLHDVLYKRLLLPLSGSKDILAIENIFVWRRKLQRKDQ